jgi:hypothetical protein
MNHAFVALDQELPSTSVLEGPRRDRALFHSGKSERWEKFHASLGRQRQLYIHLGDPADDRVDQRAFFPR